MAKKNGNTNGWILIPIPEGHPSELACSWDEHSMARRCEGSIAWDMPWEHVLAPQDTGELFARWLPAAAGPSAPWRSLDVNAQNSLHLLRGQCVGRLSRGNLDSLEIRALSSLALPRTPPLSVRLNPCQARELSDARLGDPQERFAAAQKIAGVDFYRDFGDLALSIAGSPGVAFAGTAFWESSLAIRKELLAARDEAQTLGAQVGRGKLGAFSRSV